jgi:hypothetical protein
MNKWIMMDYLEKFNDTIEEFLADIIRVFPEDDDMQLYQFGLKGLRLASPTTVCHEYYQAVTIPYYDKINTRDEEFFMEHDFTEVKNDVPDGIRILSKTLNYWKSLNDDDKETVWKYLKVLCVLSKKVVG